MLLIVVWEVFFAGMESFLIVFQLCGNRVREQILDLPVVEVGVTPVACSFCVCFLVRTVKYFLVSGFSLETLSSTGALDLVQNSHRTLFFTGTLDLVQTCESEAEAFVADSAQELLGSIFFGCQNEIREDVKTFHSRVHA